MRPNDLANFLSNLISIYLIDYESIRDEIRMRITQRHQFTNYSLFLFAGMLSIMGAVLKLTDGNLSFQFGSLRSEYLFFLLVSPYIFYALLFMYMRHDFYIYYLTIYLEKHVGRQIRKIIENYPDIKYTIKYSYILGYEKFIQEIRLKDMTPRTFILVKTISDNLMKHFPFFLPPVIFIIISSINIFLGNYSGIMLFLLSFDIVTLIVISVCVHISLRRLIKARTTIMKN